MNVRNLREFGYALLAVTLVVPAAFGQQLQINRDNKTIAITTSDDAEATADTAVVSIGFRTYGKDQDATYADASRQSNAIMDALTKAGVPKDSIQSADQSLSPIEPNDDSDRTRYSQGLRFEFSQQWHVTVQAKDAATLLHTAITSGANESGNIEWKLGDENAIEADAARKALERAKEIATRMATGLGVKLGVLVYASNQTPPRGILAAMGLPAPMLNTESASVGSVKRNLAPVAIAPQKITRSATVYAVFAIE